MLSPLKYNYAGLKQNLERNCLWCKKEIIDTIFLTKERIKIYQKLYNEKE